MAKSYSSSGVLIPYEEFAPATGASRSVVVAYGTEALEQPFGAIIRDFCKVLANERFIVILPDYFASTGTSPGIATVLDSAGFDRWVEVLADGVSFSQTLPGIVSGRTALVGFSLGGHLVMRTAAGPTVKAVVDFYGPLNIGSSSLSQSSIATLPKVQIHHGDDDLIVKVDDSVKLDSWLTASSIPHEFYRYPANGHPGQERLSPPGWSSASQDQATKLAVTFLDRWV